MIATLVCIVAAIAAYVAVRGSVAELARRAAIQATNHRGLRIAATGGVGLVLGIVVAGGIASVGRVLVGTSADGVDFAQLLVLSGVTNAAMVAVGFALFGLYDDVAGTPEERGWKSHLSDMRQGKASAGAIKIVGGSALGIAFSFGAGLLEVISAGAVIALSANLVNAFDAKPLRAIKVSLLWTAGLVVVGAIQAVPSAIGGCVVLGAVMAALWTPERQERIMLGDAGSNALGAVLGALTVATEFGGRTGFSTGSRMATLVVLIGLTLLSHRPGFSVIIDRVGFLKRFDRLGRQPDPLGGHEAGGLVN